MWMVLVSLTGTQDITSGPLLLQVQLVHVFLAIPMVSQLLQHLWEKTTSVILEVPWEYIFYVNDPLWDGAGCGPQNTCCSFNNPPWFYKQLPQHTTDDIEMRVCRDQVSGDEDVAIETIDIIFSSSIYRPKVYVSQGVNMSQGAYTFSMKYTLPFLL